MAEELVVRVRGTFIDVGRDSRENRASSVPATKGRVQRDFSEYLASWIEGADNLPCPRPHSEAQDVMYKNEFTEASHFTETNLKHLETNELTSACLGPWDLTATTYNSSDLTPTTRTGIDSWSETASTFDSESHLEGSGGTPKPLTLMQLLEDAQQDWCKREEISMRTPVTTMMICDIPCRQTIGNIIDAINDCGFTDTYDLVYVPPQKGCHKAKYFLNVGYAFVNFKTEDYAARFGNVFYNYTFLNSYSQKLSYAKPAHCQGFEANAMIHSKQRVSGCLLTFVDEAPLGAD